jgi:hypothetical protein
MSYAPLDGTSLDFVFPESSSYTPPLGDAVDITFIVNVNVPFTSINSPGSTKSLHVFPGAASLYLTTLDLYNSTKPEHIAPGSRSLIVGKLQSSLNTKSFIINRGTLLNSVVGQLSTVPLSIVTGPISFSVNSLTLSSNPPDTRSTLIAKANKLTLTPEVDNTSVLPGPISFVFDAIDGVLKASTYDAIYQPIKGLGEVDIRTYCSTVINDTDDNGGPISYKRIKNTHNSIFPSISDELQDSGGVIYRKIFWRNVSVGRSNLLNGVIYLNKEHSNSYSVCILPCGYYDTQGDIIPNARTYGTSVLTSSVTIGTSIITSILKDASLNTFRTGDTIVISNKLHNERFDNVTVVKIGNTLTITLDTPVKYLYDINDVVSSCIQINTLSTFSPKVKVTSTSGIFDSLYPVESSGNGTIVQLWTLTFTSSTSFICTGTSVISIQGTILVDFSPINPFTGTPYFFIDRRSWKGEYQSGDYITFPTQLTFSAIWAKLIIPVGNTTVDSVGVFNCVIQGDC